MTPNGMVAQYSWKVYEPSSGKMMKPNVTFNADSVAEAVSFANPTSRAASWLKHMPLASTIIEQGPGPQSRQDAQLHLLFHPVRFQFRNRSPDTELPKHLGPGARHIPSTSALHPHRLRHRLQVAVSQPEHSDKPVGRTFC